jgi:hypothetical protein
MVKYLEFSGDCNLCTVYKFIRRKMNDISLSKINNNSHIQNSVKVLCCHIKISIFILMYLKS